MREKDDAHVLAAAIGGKVEAIVTLNTKDFPASILKSHNLKTMTPDELTLLLCSIHVDGVLKALLAQASIMQNPPKTAKEVLNILKNAGRFLPCFPCL